MHTSFVVRCGVSLGRLSREQREEFAPGQRRLARTKEKREKELAARTRKRKKGKTSQPCCDSTRGLKYIIAHAQSDLSDRMRDYVRRDKRRHVALLVSGDSGHQATVRRAIPIPKKKKKKTGMP